VTGPDILFFWVEWLSRDMNIRVKTIYKCVFNWISSRQTKT
jgi:hypothetical protein